MSIIDQVSLIAFGGNLPSGVGSPVCTIEAALSRLQDHGVAVLKVSRFYQTPCFPKNAGPDFVNGCATLGCELPPRDLLGVLHRIEAEFGRERRQRWAGRTLDLDLLAIGDKVLPDAETQSGWQNLSLEEQMRVAPDQLILPHPRLQDRGFVLVPLADVAPDWRHPILGKTVLEMRDALPKSELEGIVPF